jgi:hypothetical protein
MNGLMKKNLQLALGWSLVFVGSNMFAMNKNAKLSNVIKKSGEVVETVKVDPVVVKEEAKPVTLKDAQKKALVVRFLAACSTKVSGATSWVAGLFSNFFTWIKTKFGSAKDGFKNLKMVQWFSKKKVQPTEKLSTVVSAPVTK